MSLDDMFSVSPPGPLKIFSGYVGENTPEVFNKSRRFFDPSTGSGKGSRFQGSPAFASGKKGACMKL